ncbi:MAG: phosphoribosylformylglycinamidine synthase subunit PurS, partial [Candidatus Methanofastidiosia archaeon]
MRCEVRVSLKDGIHDPEGNNVKKTLNLLGYSVSEVKISKIYEIEIDGEKKDVEEICERLLANPVIHWYTVRDVDG